jgi:tetratricopeptide (TPR) repeat protein
VFLAESGHMSAAAAAADVALARTTKAPPEARAALFGVAGTYRYELGEERAARPLLQEYLSIRPDDAAANFRLGSCLLRIAAVPTGPKEGGRADMVAQNNADGAARAFARSFELAPGDEDAALAVGTALIRAAELAESRHDSATRDQRWTSAAQQFDKVAERFPTSPEALFRLGVLAEKRGDQAAAEQAYTRALEREALHLGSLLNLAALLDNGSAPARVQELLRRALAADAKQPGLTAGERRQIANRLKGA